MVLNERDAGASLAAFPRWSVGTIVMLERGNDRKRAHKQGGKYPFRQEGSHAEMIFSEPVMREKLEYIPQNLGETRGSGPARHWRYSLARNYLGQPGLIGIDPWF